MFHPYISAYHIDLCNKVSYLLKTNHTDYSSVYESLDGKSHNQGLYQTGGAGLFPLSSP